MKRRLIEKASAIADDPSTPNASRKPLRPSDADLLDGDDDAVGGKATAKEMKSLKEVDVLYIDDFFKPIGGNRPSDADIRLAYEIINARYNRRKITIISSERHISEIAEIDEAIGGRIYEYAKGYTVNIARDTARNYRLKGMSTI